MIVAFNFLYKEKNVEPVFDELEKEQVCWSNQSCLATLFRMDCKGRSNDQNEGEGVIKREFNFGTFEEASNFILRYTEYCHKRNLSPTWQLFKSNFRSNVYNRVNVTLSNEEFGEISQKEIEAAKYLEMVHSVELEEPVQKLDMLSIFNKANIRQSLLLLRNN